MRLSRFLFVSGIMVLFFGASSLSASPLSENFNKLKEEVLKHDRNGKADCGKIMPLVNRAQEEGDNLNKSKKISAEYLESIVAFAGSTMPCDSFSETPESIGAALLANPRLSKAFNRGISSLDPCRKKHFISRIAELDRDFELVLREFNSGKKIKGSFNYEKCVPM